MELSERKAKIIEAIIKNYQKTGEPVVRSLEYECPHHGFENITDEFMVGSDILVAPVVEKGAVSRKVAFPEGKWIAADGSIYEGLSSRELPAPLDTLLWFTKA